MADRARLAVSLFFISMIINGININNSISNINRNKKPMTIITDNHGRMVNVSFNVSNKIFSSSS